MIGKACAVRIEQGEMSKENRMFIKNTSQQFGLVSKIFHWIIALLVAVQFYLIIHVSFLPKDSPLIGFLIGGLHKPIGMLILLLAVLSYCWRAINISPSYPPSMKPFEKVAAKWVHNLLYLCLIVMPLSGLIMSVAGGRPPNFFGLFQVPEFMEKNQRLSDNFYAVHQYTTYVLIALIAIHILAALKHHFINRDTILKRMWF